MRGYILFCFLILAYGRPQDDFQTAMISKHECKVIEKKSGVSKFCAGAFIFENQTYYGCTTVRSENGKHGVQPMLIQEQTNISLMATFLVNAPTRIVNLQN